MYFDSNEIYQNHWRMSNMLSRVVKRADRHAGYSGRKYFLYYNVWVAKRGNIVESKSRLSAWPLTSLSVNSSDPVILNKRFGKARCRSSQNEINVELWILYLVHQSIQIKMHLKVKTQEHRRFVGCLTVLIHIRQWRLITCVVMVTPWRLYTMRNNACHPLRFRPYRYVQKCQTQLYICRSTSLLQGFFVACVYMHINPD